MLSPRIIGARHSQTHNIYLSICDHSTQNNMSSIWHTVFTAVSSVSLYLISWISMVSGVRHYLIIDMCFKYYAVFRFRQHLQLPVYSSYFEDWKQQPTKTSQEDWSSQILKFEVEVHIQYGNVNLPGKAYDLAKYHNILMKSGWEIAV